MSSDPSILKLKKQLAVKRSSLKRNRIKVLKKLLRHRIPGFHGPLFNLIVSNTIMKDIIYQKTNMHCMMKKSQQGSITELYGAMSGQDLNLAINDVRTGNSRQHSNAPENQFLKSINTTCGSLPHSNEAAKRAREIYFSFLIEFGLPCIFLTITPDDNRSIRVKLFSTVGKEFKFGSVDVDELTDQELVAEYKIRTQIRSDCPGLCAEDYERIMKLVIKHLFNWDIKEKKSKGMGLFGELIAWCLATEEQGRKTLHGHFLLFVKNWKTTLDVLQNPVRSRSSQTAARCTMNLYREVCSARLFEDFEIGKCLSKQPVFFHKCEGRKRIITRCSATLFENDDSVEIPIASKRRKRSVYGDGMRFTVIPSPDQMIREMRDAKLSKVHKGVIGQCGAANCGRKFGVEGVIQNALTYHFCKEESNNQFIFPENMLSKRLDRIVYEMSKNYGYLNDSPKLKCLRYFAGNAFINHHHVNHCTRCFKKNNECYANLPDAVVRKADFVFNEDSENWSDWRGDKNQRKIFMLQPKRNIEDSFMNSHNKDITTLMGYNNNVMMGMNGRLVLYVTGYNAKSQQKEERNSFEVVGKVLLKLCRTQDESPASAPAAQLGFNRVLTGVYSHTSSHIIAAPMAHFISLNDSRFMYSHRSCFVPYFGLSQYLEDQPMIMTYCNNVTEGESQKIPFHQAMHYLYRPDNYEDRCLYQFFQEVEFDLRRNAIKNDREFYDFKEEHPRVSSHVAMPILGTKNVPTVAWCFLGSTAAFDSSIFSPIGKKGSSQYIMKEKYAYRFMLLFMPIRSAGDLQKDGSYQLALQQVYESDGIHKNMICIAENIQNIHNSMGSSLPKNGLSVCTTMIQDDPMEAESSEDRESDMKHEEFLAGIGEYFLSTTENKDSMKEECSNLHPDLGNNVFQHQKYIPQDNPNAVENLPSVIELHGETIHDIKASKKSGSTVYASRFTTSAVMLNSLSMETVIIEREEDPEEDPRIPIHANGTCESIVRWGIQSKLDIEQHTAFEILTSTYVLTFHEDCEKNIVTPRELLNFNNNHKLLLELAQRPAANKDDPYAPLRLFITGPAGAGKSKILEEVIAYCKQFSTNINHEFNATTIRLTAISGAAACEIGGQTTASEFGIMKGLTNVNNSVIQAHSDTRLNIIDEISMAGYEMDMKHLCCNLKLYSQDKNNVRYGSTAICFLGDFCQLEPIKSTPLYMKECGILWESALNRMVELKGTHRYTCPIMARIMTNMRESGLSEDDRKVLNSRVIDGKNVVMPHPETIRFACFHNKNRCSINAEIFKSYLKEVHQGCDENSTPDSSLVIKSISSWKHNNKVLSFEQRKILFENCSEPHTMSGKSKRIDPFLCLFSGGHFMSNENADVRHGIANGICATFVKAKFKKDRKPHKMKVYGQWVNAADIDDIDYLVFRWEGYDRFRGTFRMKPERKLYKVDYPIIQEGQRIRIKSEIYITQIPMVSNFATTGHKLQGKTVLELAIMEWNKTKNWVYVVLSRVRSLAGLFLFEPIPDYDFSPVKENVQMMERLRETINADVQRFREIYMNA